MDRKQSERHFPANNNLISVRHKYVISEPLPYRPVINLSRVVSPHLSPFKHLELPPW